MLTVSLFVNVLFVRKGEHVFLDHLSLTLRDPALPTSWHLHICPPGPRLLVGFLILVPAPLASRFPVGSAFSVGTSVFTASAFW